VRGLDPEGEDQPDHERAPQIERHHLPERVKEGRDDDGPAEERELPGDHQHGVGAEGPAKAPTGDVPGDGVAQVLVEVPAKVAESVERPQVDVLRAVVPAPGLRW
jgi:hypothetical protein